MPEGRGPRAADKMAFSSETTNPEPEPAPESAPELAQQLALPWAPHYCSPWKHW